MDSIIIRARQCVNDLLHRLGGKEPQPMGERMQLVQDHMAQLSQEELAELEKEAKSRLMWFPTRMAIDAMMLTILAHRMEEEGLLPEVESGG